MVIFQLLLKSGVVLTMGEPLPGPDGKPQVDSKTKEPLPFKVWLIDFVPETADSFDEEDESGESAPVTQSTPAHYKILLRPLSDLKKSPPETTLVYRVWLHDVLFEGSEWKWVEALDEFQGVIKDASADDAPSPKRVKLEAVPQEA